MKLDDTHFTYRHPGASMDLIVPIATGSTVPIEQQLENVRINSRRRLPWLDQIPVRLGHAAVCGAGPSLAETIGELSSLTTVFACNSAAKLLNRRGRRPTYQVLLDALPESVEELADADTHLIASTCDPSVFDAARNPVLWHPCMDGILDCIPAGKFFALIGGGITVCNSAMCIAATLGYRDIEAHGMDSSYRSGERYSTGNSTQEGVLPVHVEHNGKTYETGYDLKLQVGVFMKLSHELRRAGCNIAVRGDGLLPDIFNSQALQAERNAA